jgi:hypothetical protein
VVGIFAFASSTFAAGVIVGNDATSRANTDSYANFVIIDTNNPVNNGGYLTTFTYFAANPNTFQFLLVDSGNVVKWISDEINPITVGVHTYPATVFVQSGWNLGVYFKSTGTIPFDLIGSPSKWTPNGSGLPTVGTTLTYDAPVSGWTNRVYSFGATGELLPPAGDQCKNGKSFTQTINVPATSNAGVDSSTTILGTNYYLRASGVYRFANWGGDVGTADAMFSYRLPGYSNSNPISTWINGNTFPVGVTSWLQLWVNNAPFAWIGSYTDHVYTQSFTGTGNPIHFSILDDYYSDNSGYLTVEIYSCLPTNKDQCKKDGWKTFGVFKNQGDCVSFVTTGGKNPPALLP